MPPFTFLDETETPISVSMKDEKGKCLIEGFYDDVFTPEPAALEAAKQLKSLYDPEVYKKQLGISYFGGEQDQPLVHRVMFRPTLNIRGFQSGSVREQARTIIPKDAIAELDIRLVPYQTPEKIEPILVFIAEDKYKAISWNDFRAGFTSRLPAMTE